MTFDAFVHKSSKLPASEAQHWMKNEKTAPHQKAKPPSDLNTCPRIKGTLYTHKIVFGCTAVEGNIMSKMNGGRTSEREGHRHQLPDANTAHQ